MEFTQIFDTMMKGGAGLFTLFLLYSVYTLWNKLQLEQEYSRKRDEQVLGVLQNIANSLTNQDIHSKDILEEIKKLRETIVNHIIDAIKD